MSLATRTSSSSKKPSDRKDKRTAEVTSSEFAIRIKKQVPLPLIPIDPKLLEFPFPQDRHYKHESHSLLQSAQNRTTVGVSQNAVMKEISCLSLKHIDALLPRGPAEAAGYALLQPRRAPKDKRELKIDDWDLLVPGTKATTTEKPARPNVSWLRRTEYISAEGRTFGKSDGVETKMGVSIMRDQNLKKQLMDTSREGQIKIIEHSFLAASKVNLLNLRHPTKPNVKAAEIIPVFPDFENWPNVYALSSFDEDPTNKTSNKVAKLSEEEQKVHQLQLEEALLRVKGATDESHIDMSYFVPSNEAVYGIAQVRQRMAELGEDEEIVDDREYDYNFVRDFEAKMDDPTFPIFIELRPEEGGAFYNPLFKRLTLRKKRAVSKFERDHPYQRPGEEQEKIDKILLQKRPLSEEELAARQAKRDEHSF